MMFEHIGWTEVAEAITAALVKTYKSKVVTYDFARLMEGAARSQVQRVRTGRDRQLQMNAGRMSNCDAPREPGSLSTPASKSGCRPSFATAKSAAAFPASPHDVNNYLGAILAYAELVQQGGSSKTKPAG